MTKVVNLRKEPYDVYIGRGSIWGNPFKVGIDGTREEVMAMYKHHFLRHPELSANVHKLKNKRLGCFCKPLPCHGDILVKMVNKMCGN